MKILIIRFSSIGDIVLCTPVFRCIKEQVAGAEIHFVTKRQFVDVTAANPYIDKFHYLDDRMEDLIPCLKKEDFDLVIDLHNNLRSHQIKRAIKARSSTINKLNLQKMVLTKLKVDIMPKRHITQRSLDAAKRVLDIKDDGKGLDFFIPPEGRITKDDLPHSHVAGYIAIVIAANHFTKRMPNEKLRELCGRLDFPIVLVGGKDEQAAGNEIAELDDIKIYNACGKFSLYESADILNQARVVISMDTGMQYIACALQKPLLAIWGGTSPRLQVEPWYGSAFMKRHPDIYENIYLDLWCQPCSKYGLSYCPLGHFNCMQKQDTEYIARRAMELMERFPRG